MNVSEEKGRTWDRNIPHHGSLHRIHMDIDNSDTSTSYNQPTTFIYAITINSQLHNDENNNNTITHQQRLHHQHYCQYQLQFHPEHFKFLNDIFTVLDADCKGYISKRQLQEFVLLRCPVFKRRDSILFLFDGDNLVENIGKGMDTCTNEGVFNENDNDCESESRVERGVEDGVNEGKNTDGTIPDDAMPDNDSDQELKEDQNEYECQEYELKNSILETQNERDIFNCILGEEYQSAEQDCYFYDNDNTIISPNALENDQACACDNENEGKKEDEGGENEITTEGERKDHSYNIGDGNNQGSNDNLENDYVGHKNHLSENMTTAGYTAQTSTEAAAECTTNFAVNKQKTAISMKIKVESETFEEVWNAVIQCSSPTSDDSSISYNTNRKNENCSRTTCFGIEAWMVFCRFISLAQYQDAKRRFSARHLQQTMSQKSTYNSNVENTYNCNNNNEGVKSNNSNYIGSESLAESENGGFSELNSSGSNEVILVDVPPLERPVPITAQHLVEYELLTLKKSDASTNGSKIVGIALPALDLDHSHLLLHDSSSKTKSMSSSKKMSDGEQSVQINVFGHHTSKTSSSLSSHSNDELDFVIRLMAHRLPTQQQQTPTTTSVDESVVVRRSFSDMSWLHDTFTSQKHLGGTLCGRILPPFPSPLGGGSGPYPCSSSRNHFFDTEEKGISSASSNSGGVVGVSGSSSGSRTASTAISVASASAVMVTSAAKSTKSFLKRLSSSTSSTLKAAVVTSSSISSSKKVFPSPSSSIPYSFDSFNSSNSSRGSTTLPINRMSIKSSAKAVYSSSSMEKVGSKSLTPKRHGHTNRRKYFIFMDDLLDNATFKAKQLERYINYMLDHPALSTSFPLNVMLKASQSGVESAKRILVNPIHSARDANQLMQNASAVETARYNLEKYGLSGGNLSWVRTAAQAALALKLHGILETTGYQSVSAKLQHASLPKFSKVGTFSTSDEEGTTHRVIPQNKGKEEVDGSEDDFEKGIVCVKSNLDEEAHREDDGHGYDMLPSPLPLPERSALCAGSVVPEALSPNEATSSRKASYNLPNGTNQSRVRYSDALSNNGTHALILGDIDVDRDIDRLRNIIRTVDSSLSKCLSAGLCIGAESYEKTKIQLDFLKEIDDGEGWRGKMIGQRALLNGVDSLEQTREASLASTELFVCDISWNASLASSAVAAADEVRDAVKASRTATRAKNTAEIAAKKADHFCQTGTFVTPDEARNAEVRASKLRSQAIHSAVVEYEALSAKRQAAVALARDVKCWNVHRKNELLRTCLEIVRSQKKIARETMSAWECLRDGLQESSSISSIVHSSVKACEIIEPPANVNIDASVSHQHDVASFKESFKESFQESKEDTRGMEPSYSRFVDYAQSPESSFDKNFDILSPSSIEGGSCTTASNNVFVSQSPDFEGSFHDTFEENIPLEDGNNKPGSEVSSDIQRDVDSVNETVKLEEECSTRNRSFEIEQEITEENEVSQSCESPIEVDEPTSASSCNGVDTANCHMLANEGSVSYSNIASNTAMEVSSDDGMTDSMQSLVDGLMNWGGQWDEEEDLTPLPQGMAASMLEERGILDLQ